MDERQFNDVYLPKYRDSIQQLARKLARRDQDLFDDLEQVGLMALWKLDPSRALENEDAWVRQALWNQMVSFLRRERRQRFDSLESWLERGAQIVEGEGDAPKIIAPGERNRARRFGDWDVYGEEE